MNVTNAVVSVGTACAILSLAYTHPVALTCTKAWPSPGSLGSLRISSSLDSCVALSVRFSLSTGVVAVGDMMYEIVGMAGEGSVTGCEEEEMSGEKRRAGKQAESYLSRTDRRTTAATFPILSVPASGNQITEPAPRGVGHWRPKRVSGTEQGPPESMVRVSHAHQSLLPVALRVPCPPPTPPSTKSYRPHPPLMQSRANSHALLHHPHHTLLPAVLYSHISSQHGMKRCRFGK